MKIKSFIAAIVLGALSLRGAAADCLPADSLPPLPEPESHFDTRFKPTQLIAPLTLIAVGTVGYYSNAFKKLNVHIRDGMTSLRGSHNIYADDWLQYLPAASYMALGFYKSRARLNFKERVAVEATACATVLALTNIAKVTFREQRPHSTFTNSFPSGHTAFAFTGAELIRKEFGWGLGGVAYGVAAGVAFLRMYNGRHWLNDVIAGAGMGILSANIGYWMLSLYRRWFHWNPTNARSIAALSPTFSSSHIGLTLTVAVL